MSPLMKMTIEKALEAEMDNNVGYEKYAQEGRNKKQL